MHAHTVCVASSCPQPDAHLMAEMWEYKWVMADLGLNCDKACEAAFGFYYPCDGSFPLPLVAWR